MQDPLEAANEAPADDIDSSVACKSVEHLEDISTGEVSVSLSPGPSRKRQIETGDTTESEDGAATAPVSRGGKRLRVSSSLPLQTQVLTVQIAENPSTLSVKMFKTNPPRLFPFQITDKKVLREENDGIRILGHRGLSPQPRFSAKAKGKMKISR
jgi:hypothetical protein